MSFDPVKAEAFLASEVARAADPPAGGWPWGAPRREMLRSPAAALIGRHAAEAGLGLFHYEHRHHAELPEDWVPEHDPSLAAPPVWSGGVLPERKYQSFRHDQAIGGYHPGMRAKWTTHELCHGLVGFAWRAGASPLFVATASRLSELVPVVLWYFLDEVHLRRCPIHSGAGALYRSVCPTCEAMAGMRLDELHAQGFVEGARAFLERELLAIGRTRRTGRAVPHIHGSLDLASDGMAYAAAHGLRLDSEAFHRFAETFLVEGGGWERSLDSLEARVIQVVDALTEGEPLPALAPSRVHGTSRWVAQDLGWRLLTLWHETDGEARDGLSALIDRLGELCHLTASGAMSADALGDVAADTFRQVADGYAELAAAYVLPDAAKVLALGYPLPGRPHSGSDLEQLREGIEGALPLTLRLVTEDVTSLVAAFAEVDEPMRVPLGRRFATWLAYQSGGALADLVRYEAELTHLGPADAEVTALGTASADARYRLAHGVVVLRAGCDVVELARSAEFGDLVMDGLHLRDVDGAAIPEQEHAVVLVRGTDGEPRILSVDPDTARALLRLWEGGVPELDTDVLQALLGHGVLAPMRWAL